VEVSKSELSYSELVHSAARSLVVHIHALMEVLEDKLKREEGRMMKWRRKSSLLFDSVLARCKAAEV